MFESENASAAAEAFVRRIGCNKRKISFLIYHFFMLLSCLICPVFY